MQIHALAVGWWDDPNSRVDVVLTAQDDVKGVSRLRRALARDRLRVDDVSARMGRRMPDATGRVGGQVAVFLVIGGLSMVLQLAMFWVLRQVGWHAQVANVAALVGSTVANTAANRRWTFGVRGREDHARHQAAGLAMLVMTLAFTAAGLSLLSVAAPHAASWVETAVVGLATAAATAAKFVIMRRWVFRPRAAPAAAQAPGTDPASEALATPDAADPLCSAE